MKVLVTGGAGFIGSHVADYYAKKENEVIVFDNLSRPAILRKHIGDPLYNWNYLKRNYPTIRLVKGDVRNFQEVKEVARGIDVIIHTAAQVTVTTSITDPRTDFEINALGTFNVVEVARINDSPIVFTSTNKVYGENVNKISIVERETRYEFADQKYRSGIPETFPVDLTGHSPYGCSKLAADLYVQDYAHTYGLKTGVFRMSCIYGERQFGVEDQGWLSHFTISTILNRPITIYGDGKQVRDILHVADLVEAFNAFVNSNLKHKVFNIGGGPENTLSLLELLGLLEKLTEKKPKVSFAEWRHADQKVYVSNISRVKDLLKWEPRISLREGVERLFKWVSENISLFE